MKNKFETDTISLMRTRGPIGRLLNGIERVGNKLPHPFFLFLGVAGVIALLSALAAALGAQAVNPATGEVIPVRSVLWGEGIVMVFTTMVSNFVQFPPLGLIVTVMLGIGVAERLGLMKTFMHAAVQAAPKWAVTAVVVVISLMGNLASDSAMIIIPPLAAAAFLAAGRNPLAGFAASYAAVAAGFSANIVIAGTDVLISGITTSAAQIVDPSANVTPVANWFFMSASLVVLAVVITVMCQLWVEPRLGPYDPSQLDPALKENTEGGVTASQKRGLRAAGVAAVIFFAVAALAVLIPGSPLQGEDGNLLRSPFMSSLPVFILVFFLTVGITYGKFAGTLSGWPHVPKLMTDSIRELVPFIVVIFTAAQAIAWFNWSNLGMLVATSGAEFMTAAGLDGIWGLMLFSLFCTLPVLLLASGSAVWTLLAPVFVPMFMLAGVDPAYTQAAFRVTDSATNPLVPMNPMLPVVLGLMQRYSPRAGLGTLFSLVIPFTFVIWGVWLLLLLVWGLLGLPVGPGHELMLPAAS